MGPRKNPARSPRRYPLLLLLVAGLSVSLLSCTSSDSAGVSRTGYITVSGGDVLAPGPPDLPLQYIDCRDLAAWLLHAADTGAGGAFNTVSKPGQATMRSLLEAAKAATGSPAHLVWVPPEVIERAGIAPWTELPVWVPPDSGSGVRRPYP